MVQENQQGACLLIHGINGTPYDMQDLAAEITTRGFYAETMLLPGHDVEPWVAHHYGWDEWTAAVRERCDILTARFGSVILIGHSMGGALALHQAAQDAQVTALVAMCAPAELHAGLLPLARHGHRLLPFLPSVFDDTSDSRERWGYLRRRRLWFSATKPLYSLLQALPTVRQELRQIQCPTLIIAARNDHVVPARDGAYIYDHISAVEKEFVLLEHSWHIVTRDVERDLVAMKVVNFLRRATKLPPTSTASENAVRHL